MHGDPFAAPADYWDRISTAFEVVISLPSCDRAAYLEATCGADTALRTELESLVAAHDGAPAFLDEFHADVVQPALTQDDPAMQPPLGIDGGSRPSQVEPEDRIRHFTVHERLGSGGAGVVYRGRDTLLERDVAIKFLAPSLGKDPAARARLMREAQAASRLDDPHVCPIHAVEPTLDGGLCIVMAYCAGGTLRDRLRRGVIPLAECDVIALQVARGLASAHQAGIVHGDIKPANIGFGEGDVARLLDFGVAAHAHDEVARTARGLSGTLPYLAPELWRGATHGPRTDVWAMGVTFFEMVTGRRPFAATDPAALAAAILTQPLPPVRRPDGTAASPEFEQLIRRMLSVAPDARPADGAAVLSALLARAHAVAANAVNAIAAADETGHDTDGSRRMSPAWWTSRPAVASFIVVAAVFALWVAAIMRSPSQPTAPPPAVEVVRTSAPLSTIAVLPFTTRGGPDIDYLANGMVDLLTTAFDGTGLVRGIDPNTVIGVAGDSRAAVLDSAAARVIATAVKADRYVVGSVVRVGPSLIFRATLRRIDGREVGRAQVSVADSTGLTSGVDALVRQLIATELVAPADTVAGIAATTTTSTRALRAYLDGERELRDARPAAAMANFQAAVASDSMFALAWYRLARAARWSEVDSLSASAAQRAFQLASSLPQRQQTLVRAYHMLRFGSARLAERLLTQIVNDYPTDVEAWMLLGEVQFSSNPYYGRPIEESAAAFQKVMALDARNREVTVYLMDLAANADRTGQLDTLFSMYFSPNSAGEQPGIRATYTALHRRRVGGARPTRAAPDAVDDAELARVALQRITVDVRDRRDARTYAQLLAAAPGTRVDGLLSLATLAVADSNWARAAMHFAAATALDPDRTVEQRALFALAPTVQLSADTLRQLREALLRRRATPVTSGSGLRSAEHDDLRHYLAGVLSVRLDDASGVDAALAALATHSPSESRVAAAFAAAVRGHRALQRSDLTAALAAFGESTPDLPARLRAQHPVLGQYLDRLARGEVLRRLGRGAEARAWYQSLREGAGIAGAPFMQAADAAAHDGR